MLGQFLLEARQLAVLKLGELVEVVLAPRFFDREFGLLDAGLELRDSLQPRLLALPLRVQRVALFAHFGEVFFEPD